MGIAALQAMDITSLKAVLADLRGKLLPSRFEKAQQPDSHTLQLGWRTLKGLVWIELSWRADAPRLVRIPSPDRIGSESTLAKQLQHGLSQMALIELKQTGFERIVEFGLAARPGEEVQRTVVLELMGRHSNLLLLDNQRKVVTLGRKVKNHHSRVRPIGTGDIYSTPPPLQGIEPNSEETLERWKRRLLLIPTTLKQALQDNYQGISPSLALQIAADEKYLAQKLLTKSVNKISDDQWESLYHRWGKWLNQITHENFKLSFNGPTPYRVWGEDLSITDSKNDLSLILGNYYRDHLDKISLERLAKKLKEKLIQYREHEEAAIQIHQKLLKETANSQVLQDQADNLLCIVSPSKDIIEKAQKLYSKAKKLRRSVKFIEERVVHHSKRLKLTKESEIFLEGLISATWESTKSRLNRLQELDIELDELLISKTQKSRKGKPQKKLTPSPLEMISPSGLIIQVGRNHRQNDWISIKQSKPGDIWFHAQECPGSHVILKSSSGTADEEDLQLAANLAAYFSRAKRNKQVPVNMVAIENLQRIPGGSPGTVRHRGGSILWAQPDKALKHFPTNSS